MCARARHGTGRLWGAYGRLRQDEQRRRVGVDAERDLARPFDRRRKLPQLQREHPRRGDQRRLVRDVRARRTQRQRRLPHRRLGLGSTPPTSAPGLGSTPTSAPGLSSPLPHRRPGWARPLPHLRRDWAHQIHRNRAESAVVVEPPRRHVRVERRPEQSRLKHNTPPHAAQPDTAGAAAHQLRTGRRCRAAKTRPTPIASVPIHPLQQAQSDTHRPPAIGSQTRRRKRSTITRLRDHRPRVEELSQHAARLIRAVDPT